MLSRNKQIAKGGAVIVAALFTEIVVQTPMLAIPILTLENASTATLSGIQDSDVTGIFEGTIAVQGTKLRVVFHISRKADGTYVTTMDSPDQGAKGIPTTSTTFEDRTLKIDMAALKAGYVGRLAKSGKSIEGIFTQNGADLPLEMARVQKAAEIVKPKRPQEPKPPFPYTQREVSYLNAAGGIRLAGTLTIPKGKGPFPVALMITGSGAQDRNEELLGHKPFLVISDYLTRRGVAVLRVDDRGVGGSTGNTPNSTTEDFVGDVLTGVNFLKTQKEIDPHKIGLIGHSEGGLIGPMAASRSKDVAFVVMMAGPGLVGEQIIQLQSKLILKASGIPESTIEMQAKKSEPLYKIIREEKDDAKFAEKITEKLANIYDALSDTEKKAVGTRDSFVKLQMASVGSKWFRYFFTLDPSTALKKVKCPVLALNGSKDLQVPPQQDIDAINKYLKEAGNKDYTTKILSGLNHLFQTCKTGAPSEYATIEETISPAALTIMGDWITSRMISKQKAAK